MDGKYATMPVGFKRPTVPVLVADLLQRSAVGVNRSEIQQDELGILMTACYFFKDTDKQNTFAFAL